MTKWSLRLFILLLFPNAIVAQDASKTIEKFIHKMSQVKDYSVHVKIKPDIPLIKIFSVKATIYFKQKDKFRIISKGIAILPKQGFTDLSKFLTHKENYSALLTGTEIIQTTKTDIITILPSSDTTDLILGKLWIDVSNDLVLKSQITTRSNGTLSAEYKYGLQKDFGLPDSVVFTVDVKKFKIPKGISTDINRTSGNEENKPASKTGKIYISFFDYEINKGINDEVFQN